MARILVVDDSPTEIQAFRSILERNSHEVLTADNGADGVAMARQELPDLVLMDIVMPGLNGFQATRQLTRNPDTAHIPVVIVTTKDQETDRVWGKRQGARGYLVKPVDEMRLIQEISALINEEAH
ncbi:MAG: twitching motility response regulator PilH [Oleibacter sp.]|nr:twitching motility response regulator PilH [Thalassolituus sp.]